MKVTKDETKALAIYKELRESNKVCCLKIYSDYWYCWEVKWVLEGGEKHTWKQTGCHEELLPAMLEAQEKILKG